MNIVGDIIFLGIFSYEDVDINVRWLNLIRYSLESNEVFVERSKLFLLWLKLLVLKRLVLVERKF